jgi:hypothetical protein
MLRKLRASALVLSVITLLALGGSLTAAAPALAAPLASAGGCSARIDNPHYSSGAGETIAKGNWQCELVPTGIAFPTDLGLALWL